MPVGDDNSLAGPTVGRSYQLSDGPRLRLRMVGPRDGAAIRSLLARQGLDADELELARLVRFDPRRCAVICASALIGGAETIVALGAIELGSHSPDLLIVDDEAVGQRLRQLVADALASRAGAHAA